MDPPRPYSFAEWTDPCSRASALLAQRSRNACQWLIVFGPDAHCPFSVDVRRPGYIACNRVHRPEAVEAERSAIHSHLAQCYKDERSDLWHNYGSPRLNLLQVYGDNKRRLYLDLLALLPEWERVRGKFGKGGEGRLPPMMGGLQDLLISKQLHCEQQSSSKDHGDAAEGRSYREKDEVAGGSAYSSASGPGSAGNARVDHHKIEYGRSSVELSEVGRPRRYGADYSSPLPRSSLASAPTTSSSGGCASSSGVSGGSSGTDFSDRGSGAPLPLQAASYRISGAKRSGYDGRSSFGLEEEYLRWYPGASAGASAGSANFDIGAGPILAATTAPARVSDPRRRWHDGNNDSGGISGPESFRSSRDDGPIRALASSSRYSGGSGTDTSNSNPLGITFTELRPLPLAALLPTPDFYSRLPAAAATALAPGITGGPSVMTASALLGSATVSMEALPDWRIPPFSSNGTSRDSLGFMEFQSNPPMYPPPSVAASSSRAQ